MSTTVTPGLDQFLADAAGDRIELGYHPFPKQQEFHASPAKYRLFGGAAGPGKSKALLMEAILQANDTPGSHTLLLRRTFPELEQSLLHYFRRDIPRELYKSFNESKHVVEWKNGSTTRFGYCQSESDVYQYQGAEFLFIGIDELTLFTLRQWQFLTSRNRCPIPGSFPCMAGATNPGNIGHAWVKSLWIDKKPAPGMENLSEYDPGDYDFVSARVSDNPIYAADEGYLKSLRSLPSHLRRAFLDGDWEVFAGQYFDRFDATRHVVRAEQVPFTPWHPRWISIDWGFEHPSAAYWHATVPHVANGESQEKFASVRAGLRPAPTAPDLETDATHSQGRPESGAPTSRVVTYREFVTRRTAPRDLAREIVRRSVMPDSSGADSPERVEAIYLSPDAFARRTDEASIAEQMGDIFVAAGLPRPTPADDDRIGGWMLMYQMLDSGEWQLTDNCIELIRTLPNLVRDQARIEDIEKMDSDDAADAARYGLKSRYATFHGDPNAWRSRMPLTDRIASRAVSPDPTVRALQIRRFGIEERRGHGPVRFAHARRR
jgi:phage terminase large subunit